MTNQQHGIQTCRTGDYMFFRVFYYFINFQVDNLDPKVASIESEKRQDLYMSLLKKRGQMIQAASDGGWKLVSYAELPLRMPRTLKRAKNVDEWSERDKVWMNM